jgi:amino acid transporter
MNQTNGMKPFYKDPNKKGLKERFKDKWNKYEVLETETNRYQFRLLIAIGCMLGFFAIMFFLLIFDPNLTKYTNVSITLVFTALCLVLISIVISTFAIKTTNKVWPYDPTKTMQWRQKKDDKDIKKTVKELEKQ